MSHQNHFQCSLTCHNSWNHYLRNKDKMADTAKSIRLSLKKQLKESKIGFNLLPVPKKQDDSQGETKKSKLRMRRPSMPSRLIPKCVCSRGPIAYGLVPRPKKPDSLKSSKFSRRSMMTRDSSYLSSTEPYDSNRSLQSVSEISFSDSLDEDFDLEELTEERVETFSTEGNQDSQRNGSRRSLQSVSSSRSIGRTASKNTLQSASSSTSLNCSASSFNVRTTKRDYYYPRPSLSPVENPMSKESSRSLPSFSCNKSLGTSARSFGGRQELIADSYAIESSVYELDDESEAKNHSIASQGRKKRRSAVDSEQKQEPETFQFGHSARNRKLSKTKSCNPPECQSWVFWTGCESTEVNH